MAVENIISTSRISTNLGEILPDLLPLEQIVKAVSQHQEFTEKNMEILSNWDEFGEIYVQILAYFIGLQGLVVGRYLRKVRLVCLISDIRRMRPIFLKSDFDNSCGAALSDKPAP